MPRLVPLLRVADPVMVLGGPYSNLEATRAVLVEAARLEIPADRIICTGDVVAYGADPAATVELVRGSVRHVVMGNCGWLRRLRLRFSNRKHLRAAFSRMVRPCDARAERRCAGLDGRFAAADRH